MKQSLHRPRPPPRAACGAVAVVQVFARAPVPGAAKTRLIPALGARRAAALQRWMTERAVRAAAGSGLGTVELWCHPAPADESFARLARDPGCRLRAQRGADLGARMCAALSRGAARGAAALLIGTDCPWIDARYLREAAEALSAGHAYVLGPARDGGYVMIGTSAPREAIFAGVEWGSGRVLEQTRERLRASAARWAELAPLPDVDRPADLARLGGLWFG